MKTKKLKKANAKGITLIALVVTIIVLLILAGISVASLTGSNGLITRAQQAKKETEKAKETEEKQLDAYAEFLENNAEVLEDNTPTTVAGTRVNKPSEWSGNSKIRAISANPSSNTESSEAYVIPVPSGFYYAGGDITTGVVISDSSADENKGTSTDLIGNQYVWIPATEDTYKREDSNSVTWAGTIENDGTPPTLASKDELTLSSVTDFTSGDNAANYGINASVCSAIVKQINAEKASVKKYGGFYIGRYETGVGSVIKANVEPLASIQWQKAYEYANAMVDTSGAKSYLVSSYAWDTTIDYIMAHTSYTNYATSRDGMNENWKDREVVDSNGTVIKGKDTATRLKCRTYNTKV